MNRRQFLANTAASAVALAFSGRAAATAAHEGHAVPDGAAVPSELMPDTAIPGGMPLRPLVRLPNRSRRSGLFRARLVAAPTVVEMVPGVKTAAWAYNDSLPGPLIDATEGDIVEILFINRLPSATTVHWHGLPVPPDQDGNPSDPVPPGAERLYRFTLPEGSAGTYWYHPHPHGSTPEQVFRGLAGTFIVRSRHDPLAHLPEQHLVISDLRLARNGAIPDNTELDWMNGREGQYVLINGQREPEIRVRGRQRWRVWNACSARYLRLSLGGRPFWLVGTDGGLIGAARRMTELLLAPGERAEWIVDAPDTETKLIALAYDRQKMGDVGPERDIVIATVKGVSGDAGAIPDTLRPVPALGEPASRKRVQFSETMSMENGRHEMKFLVNGKTFDMARIDLVSRRGRIEEWDIVNASHMDHPFHLHGTQFQVVERVRGGRAVPEPFLAWRDTVNLAPEETVRIRVVQAFAGIRMFHCHILEHEGQGMMGQLRVE
ncbi:multicopper oxidase family protein [Paludibacterium paludis]|uniref:Copper oxidase n=1 Tax=Paludibacterium paludis TaxID=1225769 RepID=A0A918P3H9_9NEIS|nr:multicopper oxidase family protein [Paludibacterium paludis]GGY17226.1 copper oxidase [Paludibacterium paludis]